MEVSAMRLKVLKNKLYERERDFSFDLINIISGSDDYISFHRSKFKFQWIHCLQNQ